MEVYMRTRQRRMEEGTLQGQPEQGHGAMEERKSLPLRQVIFWLHLVTGVTAGLIIGMMSVTGVLLAFERQIVAFAERHIRTVPAPVSSVSRLDLDTLIAKARVTMPEGKLNGVMFQADPTATLVVNFGRERTVFVNPYTGEVLGEGAKTLRDFFHRVTDWHRWLGTEGDSRDIGRAITGACNAAFVVMVITGFYLWWPRRWTRQAFKAVMVPSLRLRGKPCNWNWHNTVGFWSTSVLICITLTGLVMSYQWANDLLYTLTDSTPPPRPPAADSRQKGAGLSQGRVGESGEAGAQPQRTGLEALFAVAVQQAPHWRSMTVRLPQRDATQVTVTLEEAKTLHPYPRSILTLDAVTAAAVQWEPYASYNLGRTLRAWVRPVHTGEGGR